MIEKLNIKDLDYREVKNRDKNREQLKDREYEKYKQDERNKVRSTITYIDLECAFDIETTSYYDKKTDRKIPTMYAWCFGIKNEKHLVHGRTWEEFEQLLAQLQKFFQLRTDRRLVVYVHNLAYEFQFMKPYLNVLGSFSPTLRHPINVVADYGIEFRDSQILSGESLKKVAEHLTSHTIEKLTGDLDYSLIRHHKTPLTPKEIEYIEHDVLIILYYINEQISIYGDVSKIPLTNTARVREFIKNKTLPSYSRAKDKEDDPENKAKKKQYYKYRKFIHQLNLTPELYDASKSANQGGYVYANHTYLGQVVNNVVSYDITSSYPATILTEKYPMGSGVKVEIESLEQFNNLINNPMFLSIFDITFTNIARKSGKKAFYLSKSKVNCHGLEAGKVGDKITHAEKLTTTITNIDFEIIQDNYDYDLIEIGICYRFFKGYLPKEIIESVLELYEKKTEYKGIESKEQEYALAKSMLNSVWGMMATDVVREIAIYNEDSKEWVVDKEDKEKQIARYNDENNNRFLYYPWGVFVTAYARRNLFKAINALGKDYVYSDTDSVKFTNEEKYTQFFKDYNAEIDRKLENVAENYEIPIEQFKPKNIEGEVKPIGIFEKDGHYKHFKSIGSKQYLVEYENGEYEFVLSGISKEKGLSYLLKDSPTSKEVFDRFNDYLWIPANETGKLNHTYIDSERKVEMTDYLGNTETVTSKGGVYLEPAEFMLSDKVRYDEFLIGILRDNVYPLGEVREIM